MRCFNPAKDFLLNLCKIHKDFVEKNENLCRKEIHRQKKPLKPSDLASEFEPSMTGFFYVILNSRRTESCVVRDHDFRIFKTYFSQMPRQAQHDEKKSIRKFS